MYVTEETQNDSANINTSHLLTIQIKYRLLYDILKIESKYSSFTLNFVNEKVNGAKTKNTICV